MIQHFLTYLQSEKHYSQHTILAYQRDIYDLCHFLNITPQQFNPTLLSEDDIKLFIVHKLDTGTTTRTVKRKLSAIHSLFHFLLKINAVQNDVTQRIITPKIPKYLPNFFKDSEMNDATFLTEHLTDGGDFLQTRDALIIQLLYQTGIRRAELIELLEQNIDLYNNQIKVFGKRRKERLIPIGQELKTLIQQYLTLRQQIPNPQPQLILTPDGEKTTNYIIQKTVKNIMQQVSSQKKLSPHVLRHTFATAMLNNGANINTIKQLMGHASLAATQIYTHTTFQQAKDEYLHSHPRANN